MSSATEKAKQIFLRAVEQYPADQWDAYLDGVCENAPDVRTRVDALLKAHARMGSFHDRAEEDPTIAGDTVSESEGCRVGSYKLLQQIGEGGFGVVFMAEQEEPVRRKVALKIIKPGMDTKEVIARFEAEEQALAMMDHPNIARVFDAGTTESGRPYFVMELVRGILVTDYCDKHSVNLEDRLQLFMGVCHAVQHAHQKGVIHRDIKPSNVLVTLHDGQPVVKVIDFGVAKATNARLTERTLFTRMEQLIGTPMYMSPEQAEMSGLDIDTRTDIYSLGVLLYELLTGTTPLDKQQLVDAGLDEIRRMIREKDPVKPSTKVGTLGDTATAVSGCRNTEPKKLSAFLRGDLDWIVMRALEKDRTRRYQTAKDFASDISRYLNHEPVEASRPSVMYRARKFVRRNRAAVFVSMVAACALIVLVAGAWYADVSGAREDAANARADLERARAEGEKDRRIAADLLAQQKQREKEEEEKRRIEAERRSQQLEWRKAAVPKAEKLIRDGKLEEAFALVRLLRDAFPGDDIIQPLWQRASCTWSVITDEPGALVRRKPYAVDGDWTDVGLTPVDQLPVARGLYQYQILKNGFVTLEGLAGPGNADIQRTLYRETPATKGMVRVEASLASGVKTHFSIDRYEVTNAEFAMFVKAGGYADKNYWQYEFRRDGETLSFEEAMREFRDSTGKPGPATWVDGYYPEDKAEFPVCGVSWYEAAAYARWAGKHLPAVTDWIAAAGFEQSDSIVRYSNFSGKGPAVAGGHAGLGFFGTYDMAGNVSEWCANPTVDGRRCTLGGAWNTTTYMFKMTDGRPPMERSVELGFRCARYDDDSTTNDRTPVAIGNASMSVDVPEPLTWAEVQQLIEVFDYDQAAPLESEVAPANDGESNLYRHEVVRVNAAYGGERLIVHLFLPRNAEGPFQTVVYFPGIGAIPLPRFDDNHDTYDRQIPLSLVATGRAICWPVYKGTFERNAGRGLSLSTAKRREFRIQMVQDLRRAIDYLETRSDLDLRNLTYYGFSWGGNLGPIMCVVEPRIHAAVFAAGALYGDTAREVAPDYYAPHVSCPVLMVNGRDDKVPRRVALFETLGSSDKTQELLGSGHIPPVGEMTALIDRWLDHHIGPISTQPLTPIQQAARVVETGQLQMHRGRFAQGEQCFRKAHLVLLKALGAEDAETLRVGGMLAASLNKQEQYEQAVHLLEKTLARQRQVCGEGHDDVRRSMQQLAQYCQNWAYELVMKQNGTKDNIDSAFELAIRASKLAPERPWNWLIGLAAVRRGELAAATKYMEQSFTLPADSWTGQWFIMALICHGMHQENMARDWYAAACARMKKDGRDFGPNRQLRTEVAALLKLPERWPPAEWDQDQYISLFTKLIERYPNVADLYYRRGSCYGQLAQWEQACADYARAAELDAAELRYPESLAAIRLYVGGANERQTAVRRFFERYHDYERPFGRAEVVLVCSLDASLDLDREELGRIADRVLANFQGNPFMRLVDGAALYRLGRSEESLKILPEIGAGFDNPKDELLAVLFRAMTHHQLGDAYTSRQLLAEARRRIQQQLAAPDGPRLPFQDRPVAWCMVQTLLKEAERLIESPQGGGADRVLGEDAGDLTVGAE